MVRLTPLPTSHALLATALKARGWATLADADRPVLLHDLRLMGCKWFRNEGTALLAALNPQAPALTKGTRDATTSFFSRAGRFLRELFLAGSMALSGPEPLTDAELNALDASHAEQVSYLNGFARDLANGSQPLDGTLVSRAESYGASVWPSAQEVRRVGNIAARRYSHERAIHSGADEPCGVCQERQAAGWQPIGTLRRVGDSPCRQNCHCRFLYANEEDIRRTRGWDARTLLKTYRPMPRIPKTPRR